VANGFLGAREKEEMNTVVLIVVNRSFHSCLS